MSAPAWWLRLRLPVSAVVVAGIVVAAVVATQAGDEGTARARLCLCIATGIVLRQGLALLGIQAPPRM